MKKEDVIYSRKEFLNLAGQQSMANIVTHIVNQTYGDKDNRYVDVVLNIADCTRCIALDFELDNEYDRENAMHKLDTLIDVLTDFRKAIKKECKIQKRVEEKIKKKKDDSKE